MQDPSFSHPLTFSTPEVKKYLSEPDVSSLSALPSPALTSHQKELPPLRPLDSLAPSYRQLAFTEEGAEATRAELLMMPCSGGPGARHVELLWSLGDRDATDDIVAATTALARLPLEGLKLESCVNADVMPLVQVMPSLRTLTHISVVECNVSAEDAFVALRRCTRLRSLTWIGHATDVAVYELVRGGNSTLEALEISTYGDGDGLTDDAVLAIAAHCSALTRLSLSSDNGVEDDEEAMAEEPGAAIDEDLALPRAPSALTDEAVALLGGLRPGVSGCLRLASFDLGGSLASSTAAAPGGEMPAVTDASVAMLVRGVLPALTELGLSGCASLTRAALLELATARPALVVHPPAAACRLAACSSDEIAQTTGGSHAAPAAEEQALPVLAPLDSLIDGVMH